MAGPQQHPEGRTLGPGWRAGFRVLAPLVVAGGFAAQSLLTAPPGGEVAFRAEGPGWSVQDTGRRPLSIVPRPDGLPLAPGQVLWVGGPAAGDGPGERLAGFEVDVGPGGRQSSSVDVRLPDVGVETRVFVVPGRPFQAYVGFRRGEGDWQPAAQGSLPDAPTDAAGSFRLELALSPGRLELRLDGRPLLSADGPEFGPVPRLSLWLDDARLRGFSARLTGGPAERRLGQDFLGDFAAKVAAEARARARWAVWLGLAVAFAFVASRRAGSVPLGRRAAATLVFLAPPALPLVLAAWLVPLPGPVVAVACAALALPGLRLALWVLGEMEAPPGGLRRAGAIAVAAIVAAALASAAWSAGTREAGFREQRLLAIRSGAGPLQHAPFRLDAPRTLDLGNALELPGTRRDLDLRARLTLAPGSLLELRLHAPDDQPVAGVALCAGDIGRYGASFCRESNFDFEPIGAATSGVPVGRPFDLVVQVRDTHFRALVDGATVAEAECDEFPAGAGFVLAAAGSVQVESLELDPVEDAAAPPVPASVGRSWVASLLAGVAALGLLAAWLLRQPAWQAFEGTAFAFVPIAWLLHVDGAVPARGAFALAAGAAGLVVVLHPFSVRTRGRAGREAAGAGVGPWRTAAFVVAGLCAVAVPVGALVAPSDPVERPDSTRDHVFPGPRLTPGIVAFEHPAIRRLNTWLRAHRLRGRQFPLRKPPGTVRVLAAGSSSTWGHGVPEESGLDYPTVVGSLLRERVPGVPIEALNGAVPGSSSARLLRVFREDLLAYGPDVVTLCFSFNDSQHVTQLDEDPYLDEIASPGYVQDAAAQRAGAERSLQGKLKLNRLLAAFAEKGPPTAPLWAAIEDDPRARTPPERFAANLRAWARLCAQRGVALVLVKEPVRDDMPLLWKEEFRAAIDAVAAEFGLPVVDPTPALLAAGPGTELFLDDVHPTPAGHAVIARELAVVLAPIVGRMAEGR